MLMSMALHHQYRQRIFVPFRATRRLSIALPCQPIDALRFDFGRIAGAEHCCLLRMAQRTLWGLWRDAEALLIGTDQQNATLIFAARRCIIDQTTFHRIGDF
jgi:hypothetical protein